MTQSMIIAERIFNKKSNNMVWAVSISGVEQENEERCFIFDPHKALRYAFMLKAKTGKNISKEAVEMLKLHCQLVKAAKASKVEDAKDEKVTEAPAEEPAKAEPAKEKKPRTRRVKKEKKEEVVA